MAGYTFSKSMDDSSSYTDQINPFNPRLSTGLSAFDLTNNVVISYGYELPFDQITRIRNRFTQDWRVSGITHMASGVPITIAETDDRSLVGTCDAGQIGLCIDEPTFTPGKLINDKNPRHGNPYFNTSLYSLEPLGQVGNSRRRFFHGPGMDNYDMALLKDLRFNESRSLEFRAEFFNVFNHAQFWGASSVNGNINSSQFGYVTNNSGPRIGQLAMKLNF